MKKHRLGVIGSGARARHLLKKVLKLNQDIELYAACDPSPHSIAAVKKELNSDVVQYEEYRELLKDENVDWVFIGSWNCFHKQQILAAFDAGKHVFCEKPLATTSEDCLDIYNHWKEYNKIFMIGYTLRYSPHYMRIKQIIDDGIIGDIISMEFNEILEFNHGGYIMGGWRSCEANAGTHLLEKCCHDIDIANWLVDSRVRRVSSFGGLNFFRPENARFVDEYGLDEQGRKAFSTWDETSTMKNPFLNKKDIVDNQVAIIEYENDTRATFHTNCCSGIPERRMYICGEKGTIRANVIEGTIELCLIGFDQKTQDVSTFAKGGHGDGDDFLCKILVDAIIKNEVPPTGMSDAVTAAMTCFGIDESLKSGDVVEMSPYWQSLKQLSMAEPVI